jgi:hypothetical protein
MVVLKRHYGYTYCFAPLRKAFAPLPFAPLLLLAAGMALGCEL